MRDEVLIRSFVTGKKREFLIAHPDWRGTEKEETRIQKLLDRRKKGEPLAYILGRKSFYGRDFIVTPDVLIPRPETESLIDIIKMLNPSSVLDVGTGSGCIAITTKLELPDTKVVAVDISRNALAVARKNAKELGAEIEFRESDLLESIDDKFDLIVANLPYVDETWDWIGEELAYEPELALFAEDSGLAKIKRLLIDVAKKYSTNTLLLEMDPCQTETIKRFAEKMGFREELTGVNTDFALLLKM